MNTKLNKKSNNKMNALLEGHELEEISLNSNSNSNCNSSELSDKGRFSNENDNNNNNRFLSNNSLIRIKKRKNIK